MTDITEVVICRDNDCPSNHRCLRYRPPSMGTNFSDNDFKREAGASKCSSFLEFTGWTEHPQSKLLKIKGVPLPKHAVLNFDELSDLQRQLNDWHEDGYQLLTIVCDNGDPFAVMKQKEPEATECKIWGGPFSRYSIPMQEALSCWGEGLLNKPTGGMANATSPGRKAKTQDWEAACAMVREPTAADINQSDV